MINSVWELKVCGIEGMKLEREVQVKALVQVKETVICKLRGTGRVWSKASGWAGERFCRWNR